MNGNYGVPRDIFAKVKLIGFIIWDIIAVGGSGFLAAMFGGKVFPIPSQFPQFILFSILTSVIAFYLVLPTNGGKKNWQSLYIAVKRRKKRWISFDWNRGGQK